MGLDAKRVCELGELMDYPSTEYAKGKWGLSKPFPLYTIVGRVRTALGCCRAAFLVLVGRAVAVRWYGPGAHAASDEDWA